MVFTAICCELLKKRTLTLLINTPVHVITPALLVVNCLKRGH